MQSTLQSFTREVDTICCYIQVYRADHFTEAYLSADGYDLSLVDLEKLSARLQVCKTEHPYGHLARHGADQNHQFSACMPAT